MPTVQCEIRSGAYYDSVVLMQLQRRLADLPGVLDAGVVMGTAANRELLRASDLFPAEADTGRRSAAVERMDLPETGLIYSFDHQVRVTR